MCQDDDLFGGYRWTYFSSISDSSLRLRAEKFLESTDWDALLDLASSKRRGMGSELLPAIGLGFNHMVRVVEFSDKTRWVARLRMPPLLQGEKCPEKTTHIMECEYNMIQLVQKATNIPVTRIHMFDGDLQNTVEAQFMLMDCWRGNVGMDMNMRIPSVYKASVFASMAKGHIDLSRIQLPKIGTIVGLNDDGSYRQGPIPGIGGAFDTAAEFFRAWSTNVVFGLSEDKIRESAGQFADEVMASASSFKSALSSMAESISVRNKGPFPLCHGDFGHNNMVFDDRYRFLGVIDWEGAFAGPWEISAEFPLTLSVVPPAMDVPWNYDEEGIPIDAEDKHMFADRERYVAIVAEIEKALGLTEGYTLSSALKDSKRQHLASAMRLYQRGKPGWFSRVVEAFPGE